MQDAHEAIRPTLPSRTPDSIEKYLEPDQAKLYRLIWERFIACQMAAGRDEQTQVDVVGGKFLFRASHTRKVFDGFRRVYSASSNGEENGVELPPLEVGEEVVAEKFTPEQHFTKPPARYTTASLVKTLEELGIGRPSTYAPILTTIQERGYVVREGQTFKPTELGRKVTKLLEEKFATVLDTGFTAKMEDNLDAVQSGERDWVEIVREFYEPFKEDLIKALGMSCPKCGGEITIQSGRFGAFFACSNYPECDWHSSILPKATDEKPVELDEECPQCGKKLVVKNGRYGRFIACSGFPECRYRRSMRTVEDNGALLDSSEDENGENGLPVRDVTISNIPCPKCGGRMVLRQGNRGRFWGCEQYPKCDGVLPFSTGVPCSREGCGGEFVERRSKRGKVFYSCSKYPECTEISWIYPGKRSQGSESEEGAEVEVSANLESEGE